MSRDWNAKWAILWSSDNRLDGHTEHYVWEHHSDRASTPVVFKTRAQCRTYIEEKYGFIRERPDLQDEPHGWKMPRAAKVHIVLERV